MKMNFKIKYFFITLIICHAVVGMQAISQINPDSLNSWVERNLEYTTDTIDVYNKALLSLSLTNKENNEAGLIVAYLNLGRYHDQYGHIDSAIYYYLVLKNIYKSAGNEEAVAETCLELKTLYGGKASYADAMSQVFEALEFYERIDNRKGVAICYTHMSDLLYYEDKYQESVVYCNKAISIQKELNLNIDLAASYRYKASSLLFIEGELDHALETINMAINIYHKEGETGIPLLASMNGRGNILKYMERYDEAIADYKYIYERTLELGLDRYLVPSIANIGHVYVMQKKYKEALPYNLEAIELMKASGNTKNLWENYMHVSDIYAGMDDYKNAYDYNILYSGEYSKYLYTIIDRLESEARIKYESEKKDETITEQESQIENQRNIQILYAIIATLLLLSLFGMMRSRKKIRKKQIEVEHSREELQKSLESLKSTQNQLIHAEKMASLGELTAGIAHEIQNPLNFVNNFSDVSVDMMEEMNEELTEGNITEVKTISLEIKQNLEKIKHHGQRASSIVKNMLDHSRTGNGEKELIDINGLADEYLRLAYHGIRAKDKSFQSDYNTNLEKNLPEIEVVPQDISRVLLNLINNAFYAVAQRSQSMVAEGSRKVLADSDYKPMVVVSTRKVNNDIEIKVKDNGLGIPKEILNKIFQPFFTTKPTGEGTGLGLSMSYDIITKGHGGELKVNTEIGEGTEFIIQLPTGK